MSIKQQDTDPSTPAALALSPTDPTPSPGAAKVSTDPGIGPASQPAVAVTMPMPVRRTPPMGIVVPASSSVKPRKDSVELLLDGMQGPQPERPKTTPRTDGQASAAYHAEHVVRPARTSPDEEPKVVVERPPQAPTTRIDRARVQAVIEQADAQRRAMEATAVLPQPIAPRVIVAVVAGLVVVLGLFVVLKLATRGERTDSGAAAPAKIESAVPATASPPPPIPPPPVAPADTVQAPAQSPAPPETTAAAPVPAPPPPTAKPKTPPRPAATGGSNLGEFKPTYH